MKTSRPFSTSLVLMLAVLLMAAWSSAEATVSTKFTIGTLTNDTVTAIITGAVLRNDLEIQCDCSDAKTAFSTARAGWIVADVVKRDKNCFVRLTRSVSDASDDTVAVVGPKNRGMKGSVTLTFNSVIVNSGIGGTFASFSPIPSLTQWGVLILVVLMAGTAFVIMRKRRAAFEQ